MANSKAGKVNKKLVQEMKDYLEKFDDPNDDNTITMIFKVIPGHYTNKGAVENVIKYIADHPVYNGLFGAGVSDNPLEAIEDFYDTKALFNRNEGRQVKHLVFAFKYSIIVNYPLVEWLGAQIVNYYYGNFQCYIGIHASEYAKGIIFHIHIAVNTVNYVTGKKLETSMEEKQRLLAYIKQITLPYKLNVIEASDYY